MDLSPTSACDQLLGIGRLYFLYSYSADDIARQIAEMRAMGVPEATIAKLEAGLGQLDQVAATADQQARQTCAAEQAVAAETVALSQRSQADWEGVRPWMAALQQFSDWYAGNTDKPPVLD